jgi:hypothetical protein
MDSAPIIVSGNHNPFMPGVKIGSLIGGFFKRLLPDDSA